MKKSWKIGSAFGIPISLHWSFALLLLWVLGVYLFSGAGLGRALGGAAFVGATFACVILHELGHSLMARRFGIGTRSITMYPIGGVAALDRIPRRPSEEIAVALAGPAVNVGIALFLGLTLWLIPGPVGFSSLNPEEHFLSSLLLANIVLVVFNLIPAFPMDGGRVFRALLATRMSHARATEIAARVGQALAMGFGALAFMTFTPTLFLIAAFVFLAAEGERRAAHDEERMRQMSPWLIGPDWLRGGWRDVTRPPREPGRGGWIIVRRGPF